MRKNRKFIFPDGKVIERNLMDSSVFIDAFFGWCPTEPDYIWLCRFGCGDSKNFVAAEISIDGTEIYLEEVLAC